MTKEEFLELMGKGAKDENPKLIEALEKVMRKTEEDPEEDLEEGWHSDFEEEFIQMFEKDPDAAWLGLMDKIISGKIPEEMLRHYGIDGMKWGVRNGPPYPLERQKGRAVISRKDKARIVLDNMDDLSLEELKALMTRLDFEEKLMQMTADQKKQGKSYTTKILSKVGDTVISVAVPAVTTYAIKKIIENVGGEDVASEMFSKKK